MIKRIFQTNLGNKMIDVCLLKYRIIKSTTLKFIKIFQIVFNSHKWPNVVRGRLLYTKGTVFYFLKIFSQNVRRKFVWSYLIFGDFFF